MARGKEEILSEHLDYLKILSTITDSRFTELPGSREVREGTRIMYDAMYGRILRTMEVYHQERLRDELINFLRVRNHDVLLSAKGDIEAIDEYLKPKP